MKLLLDENLSRRLLPLLAGSYPESTHVALQGPERASDRAIWEFAKAGDYVLVTKDDDFTALSILQGRPPFLIELSVGNCGNERLATLLSLYQASIEEQFNDPTASMVQLARPR
jgi:predicted nuclease of predicted toxin-antitoxin system